MLLLLQRRLEGEANPSNDALGLRDCATRVAFEEAFCKIGLLRVKTRRIRFIARVRSREPDILVRGRAPIAGEPLGNQVA